MKLLLKQMIGNVFILFAVLLCAFSCTKQKERMNGNNSSEVPQAVEETVVQKAEPDFIDGWQYGIEKDMYKSVLSDPYNSVYHRGKIVDDFQYIELKTPSRAGIVVSYLPSYEESPYTRNALFLLNAKLEITMIYDEMPQSVYDIDNYLRLKYDFIKDIPGRQVGNSSVIVGDYNKDDIDEIMIFTPIMRGYVIQIFSYNHDRFGIETLLSEIEIVLENRYTTLDRGPPIQFGTYNSMDGFILFEVVEKGVVDGPVYDYMEYSYEWYFYTWDNKERKFIKIEQVNPDNKQSFSRH